jgi:hypothetical protein
MKISIKYLLFSFIVLFSYILFSCSNTLKTDNESIKNINPAEKPNIEFQKNSHDFGEIKYGEVVSCIFKFKNTGKSNLIITNAEGSCGCTVPKYSKDPILPENEGTIEVIFNSRGQRGTQIKTVTVFSNTEQKYSILTIVAKINEETQNLK